MESLLASVPGPGRRAVVELGRRAAILPLLQDGDPLGPGEDLEAGVILPADGHR